MHTRTQASEFKKGCEGTGPGPHNSYVENADDVQCNTTSGTTITCDKKITHCTASAQVTYIKPIRATAGVLSEVHDRQGQNRCAARLDNSQDEERRLAGC